MKIKSKQIEDTLRTESSPFDIVYADKTVGDLNGAIRFTAKNTTGSAISAYAVVYISGISGNTPTIGLADANSANMPAFGLTVSAVNNNATVDVITFGNISGVDTSSFSLGDTLYVSNTAGEFTSTPPAGSSSKLQNIGTVLKVHASGIIKVGGAGRSAVTPNLDQGKIFIGNASNQSSVSAYSLPISDGTNGQVLATDGSGALSFSDQSSGGTSITTQRVTSGSSITAAANYRYVIDSITRNWTLNLPTSPSLGDVVYIFPRYYASVTIQTTDLINIARSGWYTEPYSEAMPLNDGVEIMIIYNGSDWLVESPAGEVKELQSTSINELSFKRYDTVFWTYTNHTCTLPDASLIPEGMSIDIVLVQHLADKYSTSNYASKSVTFNSTSSANELIHVGVTDDASPVSSVEMILPRFLKIIKYNDSFYLINPAEYTFKTSRPGDIIRSIYKTNTTFTAYQNMHYYLSSTTTDRTVTLPDIDDLELNDQIKFSLLTKINDPEPASFTLSLSTADASGSIYLTSRGYQRYSTSFATLTLPLTTGTVTVTKATATEYDVELVQTGSGIITTVSATTKSLLPGFSYLIDTATAGGDVTLTLPVADSPLIGSQINIKIEDDSYDVILDGYGSNTIDEVATVTYSAKESKYRSIVLQTKADSKWMVVQDTGAPILYSGEITATSTLSALVTTVKEATYTVNHATNAITVTLPAIANVPKGFKYNFKRLGAGTVAVSASSGEQIDHSGQTSINVSAQYDNVILQSTGTFWLLLG